VLIQSHAQLKTAAQPMLSQADSTFVGVAGLMVLIKMPWQHNILTSLGIREQKDRC
jgi:hypothetical protein